MSLGGLALPHVHARLFISLALHSGLCGRGFCSCCRCAGVCRVWILSSKPRRALYCLPPCPRASRGGGDVPTVAPCPHAHPSPPALVPPNLMKPCPILCPSLVPSASFPAFFSLWSLLASLLAPPFPRAMGCGAETPWHSLGGLHKPMGARPRAGTWGLRDGTGDGWHLWGGFGIAGGARRGLGTERTGHVLWGSRTHRGARGAPELAG